MFVNVREREITSLRHTRHLYSLLLDYHNFFLIKNKIIPNLIVLSRRLTRPKSFQSMERLNNQQSGQLRTIKKSTVGILMIPVAGCPF